MDKSCINTDIEIFRKEADDYYSPSIFKTSENKIGINVGGSVIVKDVEEWHKLATNGGWKDARISPPLESGRYWCLVAEQTDLGPNHYQCNCAFNVFWTYDFRSVNVVYWMPLMPFPVMLPPPPDKPKFKEHPMRLLETVPETEDTQLIIYTTQGLDSGTVFGFQNSIGYFITYTVNNCVDVGSKGYKMEVTGVYDMNLRVGLKFEVLGKVAKFSQVPLQPDPK